MVVYKIKQFQILKDVFDLLQSKFIKRVESFKDGSLKKKWILRNYHNILAEDMQTDSWDIHLVNLEWAFTVVS